MIILYLFIIPSIFILVKLILYLIVKKYGKFSYDGFSAAGFAYNTEKDIFYSTKNAWQKNFGYTHLYDVVAPIFNMIIDTESVRFNYNNKNWLITFWKGQYGIVTGAEIGIYCTNEKKANKKTVYLPASENEMLNMDLVLYKKGRLITKARAKHWWLTVFKLGMFSRPKDLSVDINLTFPNREMLQAFLISFRKLGYKSKDYFVIDNTFCFKYKKPHTRKIWTRNWISDSIRQSINRKNVDLYNKCLDDFIDDNGVDDSRTTGSKNVIILNELIPDLLKNNPDGNSWQITNKIFSEKENNVVLLDNNIYSGTRVGRQ